MRILQFIADLAILSNTCMNKDAILATLIGFGIGLVITGILLVGPNLLKLLPSIKLPAFTQSQQLPTPTPAPKVPGFAIESPLPETIENTPDLLVNGTASPGATIVIAGPGDESVVTVGSDGKFAGKITLTEGKDDITVTSVLGAKITSQTVTVYFTQESL